MILSLTLFKLSHGWYETPLSIVMNVMTVLFMQRNPPGLSVPMARRYVSRRLGVVILGADVPVIRSEFLQKI